MKSKETSLRHIHSGSSGSFANKRFQSLPSVLLRLETKLKTAKIIT
jgi:hypothetical protein